MWKHLLLVLQLEVADLRLKIYQMLSRSGLEVDRIYCGVKILQTSKFTVPSFKLISKHFAGATWQLLAFWHLLVLILGLAYLIKVAFVHKH